MPRLQFCKICEIPRDIEHFPKAGNLCKKCKCVINEQYREKKFDEGVLLRLKSYIDEIVVNYNRKSATGVLCACKDLAKYYHENKISTRW